MDMSRDDFLASLISELEKQRNENVETFERPKAFSTEEVYRKLCYDSPLVGATDVEVLWTHVTSLLDKNDTSGILKFRFDSKFVENVVLLAGTIDGAASAGDSNSSSPTSGKSLLENASALCSILFVKATKYLLLSCKQRDFSRLFDERSVLVGDDSASELLSWAEIATRFSSFVNQGTASLLQSTPLDVIRKHRIMYDMIDIVGMLNPFGKHILDILHRTGSDSSLLQPISVSAGKLDKRTLSEVYALSVTGTSTDSASADEQEALGSIQSALKEVWVQRILTARDIFTHNPALIEEYLPLLTSKLLEGVYAPSKPGPQYVYLLHDESLFPVANECLVVILYATLSQYLLSAIEQTSTNRNTVIKRSLQKLRTTVETQLPMIARICERMCSCGHQNNMDEGVAIAVDICSLLWANRLYCSDAEYRDIDNEMSRIVDRVISCRLFPWLIQCYLTHSTAALACSHSSDKNPASTNILSAPVTLRLLSYIFVLCFVYRFIYPCCDFLQTVRTHQFSLCGI
jgi:hypothetical protein